MSLVQKLKAEADAFTAEAEKLFNRGGGDVTGLLQDLRALIAQMEAKIAEHVKPPKPVKEPKPPKPAPTPPPHQKPEAVDKNVAIGAALFSDSSVLRAEWMTFDENGKWDGVDHSKPADADLALTDEQKATATGAELGSSTTD